MTDVVCDIQFASASPPDSTVPGLFFNEVKADFPERNPVRVIETEMKASQGRLEHSVKEIEQAQLVRADKRAFVQVSPLSLIYTQRAPYSGWEDFRKAVDTHLSTFVKIAKPTGVKQLNVLFHNRIALRGSTVTLEDYFRFYPFLGPDLPQDHGPFFIGVHVPMEDQSANLRIEMANGPTEHADECVFLLNLRLNHTAPSRLALDKVVEWLDSTHSAVNDAFEGCITDTLREQFGVVK